MNIQHILDTKAELDKMVQECVDNHFTHKDIPLEERWELYKKINQLLPFTPWVSDNAIEKTLRDVSLYDEFNIEKYQTVRYADFVEGQEDDIAWLKDNPEYENKPRFTEEQLNTLKEYILASGYQGFTFDW